MGKTKGRLRVDGLFELEDGGFNPETGLRDFEAEKALVPNKDYSNDLAGSVNEAIDDANLTQPPRTDAPEIEAGAVKVETASPTQPTTLVNKDVLLKAAKDAKKRDTPVTFDDNQKLIGLFNWEKMDGPMDAKRSWTVLVMR